MPKSRISYFMADNIGGFYYGSGHVMKPHRLSITHNLNLAYGLYRKMDVYRPRKALPEEIIQFHSKDYIDFLSKITPDNVTKHMNQLKKYNFDSGQGSDCPVFDGIYEFCRLYTGGSIDGAKRLMSGQADIAINWAGGLHHAKKTHASGFCYVNDIVISILELLKYYARVLYIDIDVHHGDGVEEAFYVTDRVMTVSFHKYEKGFFPSTGSIWDTGAGLGELYAVNVPLKGGIDDESYRGVFNPVISEVMQKYKPEAIVLQCGADSLAKDDVGDFNLTIKGHGDAVKFVKSFGVPTLVLGGGGYNIRSVARCWAYETGLLLDQTMEDQIPFNNYWEYFKPDYKLHFPKVLNRPNQNTKDYLDQVRSGVLENLRGLTAAPSVPMQQVPPMNLDGMEEDDISDRAQADGEFFDDGRDQGMEN